MTRKYLQNKLLIGIMSIMVGSVACKKNSSTEPVTTSQNNPPDTIGCNHSIKSGGVLTNDPLAPIDYIVTCDVSLNGDVTIEQGTVIAFATDAGFQVRGSGSLAINGTKDQPVLLTGIDKKTGSWKGLLFNSDDSKNSMNYTTVEYAGGAAFNSNGDLGGVLVWAGSTLKMSNSTIRNSASYGLNLNYGDVNVTLNNNTFTGNDMPARFKAELLHLATANNDYTGNKKDFIYLDFYTSEINSAATWHKTNVPYLANGTLLTAKAMLTIEPGVEVVMGQGTYIHIGEKGALKAVGTPDDPIIFRGEAAQPGAWQGIGISFSSNPLNEISNAKIMHAGGGNRKGAIYMWAKPSLKVSNVLFSDIKTCALYTAPNTSSPNPNLTLSNCTYVNCGGELCGD